PSILRLQSRPAPPSVSQEPERYQRQHDEGEELRGRRGAIQQSQRVVEVHVLPRHDAQVAERALAEREQHVEIPNADIPPHERQREADEQGASNRQPEQHPPAASNEQQRQQQQ